MSEPRYIDMALELRDNATREALIRVGGKWDRKLKRYVGPADKVVALGLQPAQIDAARWYAAWLRGYVRGKHTADTERVWSVLLAGGRRGGKSDLAVKALMLFLIAVAGNGDAAMVWAVSAIIDKTQELRDVIDRELPADWYRYSEELCRYTLVNGSRLWLLSGFKPDRLKRGRADVVLVNEAQEFPERVYALVRPATADTGGLVMLTANPPSNPIGQWVLDAYEDAKAGRRRMKLFEIDPKLNPFAVPESLADLKHELDEITFRKEIGGEFLPIGDRVLYAWSSKESIRPLDGAEDVTGAFTQKHFGRAFPDIIGADFQRTPYMAAVQFRAYRDPADPAGEPLLWAVGYWAPEETDEDGLIDVLERDGLSAERTVVIADASGEWQDAERTRGRGSYDVFRRRGWRYIYPPDANSKRNPDIIERVTVANARIKDAAGKRHVFSVPANDQLNKSLRDWENKGGRPHRRSRHAHLADAFSYPLYRFYPRQGPRQKIEFQAIPRGHSARREAIERYW